MVKVRDLMPKSNVEVPVSCDFCKRPYHLSFATASINQQQVCKDCHGNKIRIVKGYSYNEIKATVEAKGFTLLTSEEAYLSEITSESKLGMFCPKKHLIFTTFHNWLRGLDSASGYRCAACNNLSKPNLTDIKECFEKKGYKLRSSKYENSHTKLNYTCPNGYEWHISWNEWQSKNRKNRCPCKKCSGRNPKYSIQDIKYILEPYGRKVLSKIYIPNGKKAGEIKILCPKHGPYINRLDIILSKIGEKKSFGCSKCGRQIGIQNQKHGRHVSAPQLYLNYLLGGDERHIEKFVDIRRLDIILPDTWLLGYPLKVFLEYDGGGHFRSVNRKKNPLTFNEVVDKDNKKRKNFFDSGWKGIIIKSSTDKFPSDEKILEFIKMAVEILRKTLSPFVTIDLDQGMMLYGAKSVSKVIDGKPVYLGKYQKKLVLGKLKLVNKKFAGELYEKWIEKN